MTPKKLDKSLIANFALFSACSSQNLEAILADAQPRQYEEGEAVFEQGGDADDFFVLLHGRLKVCQITRDGRQIVVRHINPGEMAGIAWAMRRKDYPATACAVTASLCLAWKSADWDKFVSLNPVIAMNALQVVGERLHESHLRVQELATEEVERRIAHAILRLVKQAGRKTAEGVLIDFPVTRQDIAEMAGTTLHTVSRLLSGWETRGLINSARRKVVVVDPHRLVLLADGQE